MIRSLALALLALTVLPTMPAQAQTCRAIGSSYFCADGRSGQRAPTTPSMNSQRRDSRLGNQHYTNPQKRAKSPGNSVFPTDPTTTRRIGDTVYNPDGSKCRTVGNSMICQ